MRAFGVAEHDGLGNAGRNAARPLAFDAVLGELARDDGQIGSGSDLEGQPRQRVGRAGVERNRFKPELAGKKGAVLGRARSE